MAPGGGAEVDPLRAAARSAPNRIAVEGPVEGVAPGVNTPGVRWTYRELDERADAAAAALRAAGVEAGSRVAIVLPPGPEAVLLLHAAARVGATLVPLNSGWTEPELEASLQAVAPVRLVLRPTNVSSFLGGGPGPEPRSGPEAWPAPPRARVPGSTVPAAILLTSGSSGPPRGVALSWENLRASATGVIRRLGLSEEDRWLALLSPAHVGGLALLHRAAVAECTLLTRPRFDPDEVGRLLDERAFTHASLVPVMLARLIEARLRVRGQVPPPASLGCLLIGGAETPAPLLERALALGYPIALTYGLTEATSQVATATPEELRRSPGAVGRPLPGVEVRIEDGEILVRGPTVASGAPRLAGGADRLPGAVGVDPEGWLHTGDLGHLEVDGVLRVTGRISARIVTGGVTVDPGEVEGVLLLHADVSDACVVGLPDPEWGERIAAAVVLRGGRAPGRDLPFLDELRAFARERLASAKRPRELRVLDALPRNANGKVDRAAVVRAFLPDPARVSSGP